MISISDSQSSKCKNLSLGKNTLRIGRASEAKINIYCVCMSYALLLKYESVFAFHIKVSGSQEMNKIGVRFFIQKLMLCAISFLPAQYNCLSRIFVLLYLSRKIISGIFMAELLFS